MEEIVKKVLKDFEVEYTDNQILINWVIEMLENENIDQQNVYDFLKDILVISKNRIGIVRYKTTRFDMDDHYFSSYIIKKNDKKYLVDDSDDLLKKIIYQPGSHIITSNMVIFKDNDIVEREIYERKYGRFETKEERSFSFPEYNTYLSYDFDLNREVYKDNFMIKEEQFKNGGVLGHDSFYGSVTSDYKLLKKPNKDNYYEKTILESINYIKAQFIYDSNSVIDPIYCKQHFDEISFEVDIDYDNSDSIYKFSDKMHNDVIQMRKEEFRKQRQKIKKL